MKKAIIYYLSILCLVFFITACGSSSSDNNGGGAGVSSLSGSLYYPNAGSVKVCADENGNGYPDDSLCVDATDKGNDEWGYVLTPAPTVPLASGIMVASPVNKLTQVKAGTLNYNNYLTAPIGYETISMFTTFVQTQIAVKGLDEAAAITAVKTELKLPETADPKVKPSGDTEKMVNVLAEKTAKSLQDAVNQLQDFDVTQGLIGLLSVVKESLALVADAISEAIKNGTSTDDVQVTLPPDLQDKVEDANNEAEAKKGITFPNTLRRVQTGVANGKLYAFLGYKNETADYATNPDVLIYDIVSGKWEETKITTGFKGYSFGGQINKAKLRGVGVTDLGGGNTTLNYSYSSNFYEMNGNIEAFDVFENRVLYNDNERDWRHIKGKNADILPQNLHRSTDLKIDDKRVLLYDNQNREYSFDYLNSQWSSFETDGINQCYKEDGKSYNMMFSNGDKIFLGYFISEPKGDYCIYNIQTKKWEPKQTDNYILPSGFNRNNVATVIFAPYNKSGKGYILFGEGNSQLLDKYVELDMNTLTWGSIKTATGDVPPITVGAKMDGTSDMGSGENEQWVYDGKIYVVGGKSGFLDKAWVFDTATGVWKRI